jgi:glycosyltransferase involved in cell wall biosynthesis
LIITTFGKNGIIIDFMNTNTVLIIGTVYPEPNSTAAGNRMLQIIEQFQIQKWNVIFASAASKSEFSFDLESISVKTVAIELNNASFDTFILELNPTIVVFDRFMIEEQFGWRVAENCPNCMRILDTEDLHFVRNTRLENFKKGLETTNTDYLKSDLAKREIASIYRCDISLIISKVEMKILTDIFKIEEEILHYLPFLLNEISISDFDAFTTFAERKNFVTIGNFRHEPNWNAVLYLKQTIWPLIKKQLPDAELHVYGSYITPKAMQLHNEKEGFLVKGRAENAFDVIKNARILLAPIRVGAGIKGKLTDAMQCGTPSITSTIGAEGMHDSLPWNGCITDKENEFANAAIDYYLDENKWEIAQQKGIEIVNNQYNKVNFGNLFIEKINTVKNDLENQRTQNFIGEMLQMQTLKSTKYMSKWIEEKNK